MPDQRDPPPEIPHETPPEPPRGSLAPFTPVPRKTKRADGWKPEVQQRFIEALADTGSVAAACRMVGRSERSAYMLRRHPQGAEFAAAWAAAQGHGVLRLQDAVLDRALNGVEVPVVAYGGVVATYRRYDNRLAAFILRNHLPGQYGEDGGRRPHAIDARKLARLKNEWRQEWLAQDREDEQEVQASLDRWLDDVHQNRLSNMSPAQRERQIAADAQARADEAAGWRTGDAYGAYAERAAELLPRFIAEVEAEWPALPPWAWEDPEGGEDDGSPPPPAPGPPPPNKPGPPDPPSGPRIRTLKDDRW